MLLSVYSVAGDVAAKGSQNVSHVFYWYTWYTTTVVCLGYLHDTRQPRSVVTAGNTDIPIAVCFLRTKVITRTKKNILQVRLLLPFYYLVD